MCPCVLLPPGRFGPLRAEVFVGSRRVRLVQALLSSPSSAGLVLCPLASAFPFLAFPGFARFGLGFIVLVFSPSLFFCVPLFASWLSNFHLIFIFTSSSFPFLFIFISQSGPSAPRQRGVCVEHLNRCKTSNLVVSSYLYLYIGFISYTHVHLRPRFHLLGRLVRFRFWGFSSLFIYIYTSIYPMQGACDHHANACQRSYAWWWKPGLITLVYLHCCDHLLFRVCFHSTVNVCGWEEAQPKNLQVVFKIQNTVRLSQSEWAASELSCMNTSLRFLTSNLPNMPVSFIGLFVHVRCIPHQ